MPRNTLILSYTSMWGCVTYLQPYINWSNIYYVVVYQLHNNVYIEHTVVVKELKMSADDYTLVWLWYKLYYCVLDVYHKCHSTFCSFITAQTIGHIIWTTWTVRLNVTLLVRAVRMATPPSLRQRISSSTMRGQRSQEDIKHHFELELIWKLQESKLEDVVELG